MPGNVIRAEHRFLQQPRLAPFAAAELQAQRQAWLTRASRCLEEAIRIQRRLGMTPSGPKPPVPPAA